MKKISLAAVTLTALLAACGQQPTSTGAPTAQTPAAARPAYATITPAQVVTTKSGEMYVRNQLVVHLRGQDAQAIASKVGGSVLDRIPELNVALIGLPDGQDARAVSVRLMQAGSVVSAAAQQVMRRPKPVYRDLPLNSQDTKQVFDTLPQYALDANHMDAQAAWDAGFTGKGVKVGVIDDPSDVSHPDLNPTWAGKAFDPVTNQTYTDAQAWIDAIDGMDGKIDQKVDPDIEHGTAVASTIASAKNGKGIVGVAPDSTFFTAAIFQPGFIGDYFVARAIVWSVNQGSQVLNNSWGGEGYSPLLKQAFDYALERNVVVVASAGNSARENWQSPAQLPGLLASAALDINNTKASFSSFGRHVSVAAPGVDVLLASPLFLNKDGTRKSGYTAAGGSGYQLISGTSFSGPYTAGTAALILGAKSDLDPYQVRRLMEETADGSVGDNASGFDRQTGYGLIRLDRLATRLKAGTMPQKGGAARVKVEIQTPGGMVPGILSDVILEGEGQDGAVYGVQTDADGYANFVAIAPGTYTLRVGTPDLTLTGGQPSDRATFVGQLTVTSGDVIGSVAPNLVMLTKGAVDLNPVDPYEPNDTPATATPIAYGQTTKTAYIFGKAKDLDYFKFTGAAGDKILAEARARAQIGGSLDTYLTLIGPDGKTVLAENDDRGTPRIDSDSEIAFTLPAAGQYYLVVTSYTISQDDQPDDSPFNKYQLKLSKTN